MHPLKALWPIDVTLEGIVKLVSASHLKNASLPIDVTLEGIATDVTDDAK